MLCYNKLENRSLWVTYRSIMVAAPSPPILRGDLTISDQNNCGGPEHKVKVWGWIKFKGVPKI